MLARTAAGKLYERVAHDRFVEVVHRHGPAQAAALADSALWLADPAGLYRLTARDNHILATPSAVEELVALPDSLLVVSARGVHERTAPPTDWTLLSKEAERALPTGDRRYPVLLLEKQRAAL